MLNIHKIEDINDSRISLYKDLRFTPKKHQEKKLFIAEGKRLVRKLLSSNIPIYSILAIEDFFSENQYLISNRIDENTPLYSAEKKIMEQIVGFRLHSGVMAMAFQPAEVRPVDMKGIIVATNGINNAENIGSIVRNMVGFGIENIIVDRKSVSPYLRRAVRVSMGSVFFSNVCHSEDLVNDINFLKHRGYKIISIEISENSKLLNTFRFDKMSLIIFGSEDYGIEKEILEISDAVIKIPMSDKIDSFNVSSSSAVVFYQISGLQFD
jgi:tRNA G18 (ribose-2'-O)-methylase SpoU